MKSSFCVTCMANFFPSSVGALNAMSSIDNVFPSNELDCTALISFLPTYKRLWNGDIHILEIPQLKLKIWIKIRNIFDKFVERTVADDTICGGVPMITVITPGPSFSLDKIFSFLQSNQTNNTTGIVQNTDNAEVTLAGQL